MSLLLCFFFSSFFFNDRLEQRNLRKYRTDFHQIFSNCRHFGVDVVQSGIGFAIGQGMLPWQPILDVRSAEIDDTPSFLGLFYNGWQGGKAMSVGINSTEVLSTSFKNLVNFGPLTPKFTVMVWRPFMRQMAEIGETRSILGTRIRQRMAGTAERICAKLTRKTCLVLRSDKFECQGQMSRSPGAKNALCTHNNHAAWTEWYASLQITSCKQQTRRFDRCRGMSSQGCVRWAWRATAGLCHAFLVYLNPFHTTDSDPTKQFCRVGVGGVKWVLITNIVTNLNVHRFNPM